MTDNLQAVRVTDVLLRVSDEDLRWCKDAAIGMEEAGGPINNMRAVGLRRLISALEAAFGQGILALARSTLHGINRHDRDHLLIRCWWPSTALPTE